MLYLRHLVLNKQISQKFLFHNCSTNSTIKGRIVNEAGRCVKGIVTLINTKNGETLVSRTNSFSY